MKRSAFWHISSAWRLLELMQATPMIADCQRSRSPTSATATLKVWRSRAVRERTTWRFSLSEVLVGTCRLMVRVPTTIASGEYREMQELWRQFVAFSAGHGHTNGGRATRA